MVTSFILCKVMHYYSLVRGPHRTGEPPFENPIKMDIGTEFHID
jgi:hypothetical protein